MVKRNVKARQNTEDIFSNFALERKKKKHIRRNTLLRVFFRMIIVVFNLMCLKSAVEIMSCHHGDILHMMQQVSKVKVSSLVY